jgi:hypothetical protein
MTLDELKTLLALNGNQRLAHLEEEIFADKELYTYYLKSISTMRFTNDVGSMIRNYAIFVIGGRWPEAEKMILENPYDVYFYTTDIIKGRWPEGEAVIATNPTFAQWYNEDFGTDL